MIGRTASRVKTLVGARPRPRPFHEANEDQTRQIFVPLRSLHCGLSFRLSSGREPYSTHTRPSSVSKHLSALNAKDGQRVVTSTSSASFIFSSFRCSVEPPIKRPDPMTILPFSNQVKSENLSETIPTQRPELVFIDYFNFNYILKLALIKHGDLNPTLVGKTNSNQDSKK